MECECADQFAEDRLRWIEVLDRECEIHGYLLDWEPDEDEETED